MDLRHFFSEALKQVLLFSSIVFVRNQPLRVEPFQHSEPVLNGHRSRIIPGRGSRRWIYNYGLWCDRRRGRLSQKEGLIGDTYFSRSGGERVKPCIRISHDHLMVACNEIVYRARIGA